MEHSKQKPTVAIFPLVDESSRVLSKPDTTSRFFIGVDEFEVRPMRFRDEPNASNIHGWDGPFMHKPTDFEKVPLDFGFGPASGYRSFRYFDINLPTYKPQLGEAIPSDANIWGVLIPSEARENLARALFIIRRGRVPEPGELQEKDLKQATRVLFEYFIAHFYVDNACKTIESLILAGTGESQDLFLSRINSVPGARRSLGAISHYQMWHGARTSELEHCGLTSNGMSIETFKYKYHHASSHVNNTRIKTAYSQLLTDLLTQSSGGEYIPHLGWLVGRNDSHIFKAGWSDDEINEREKSLNHMFGNETEQFLPCIVW